MGSIREGECSKEDEGQRATVRKGGRIQCEQGSEGLGQSAAGRQRGLICLKGSSASYAI